MSSMAACDRVHAKLTAIQGVRDRRQGKLKQKRGRIPSTLEQQLRPT